MTFSKSDIENPDRETSAEAAGRHLREAFGKQETDMDEHKKSDPWDEVFGKPENQHEGNMELADSLIQDAYFLKGKVAIQRAVVRWAIASGISDSQRKSLAAALDAGMDAKP